MKWQDYKPGHDIPAFSVIRIYTKLFKYIKNLYYICNAIPNKKNIFFIYVGIELLIVLILLVNSYKVLILYPFTLKHLNKLWK